MSNTMKNELNKIVLGSMDFYVVAFTGTDPADTEIEKDENMIGRTKNGGTLNYSSTWTTAESDDGKAKRKKIVSESATISYGVITWNAKTIAKLVATARVSEASGKRKAKIGGVENDNGTRYLIRGVHKDKVAGDIRITGVGVNTGGWESAFQPENPTTPQAQFELEPLLDDEGTLCIYEEEMVTETQSDPSTNPEGT